PAVPLGGLEIPVGRTLDTLGHERPAGKLDRRGFGPGVDRLLEQLGVEGLDRFGEALVSHGRSPARVIRTEREAAYNSPGTRCKAPRHASCNPRQPAVRKGPSRDGRPAWQQGPSDLRSVVLGRVRRSSGPYWRSRSSPRAAPCSRSTSGAPTPTTT